MSVMKVKILTLLFNFCIKVCVFIYIEFVQMIKQRDMTIDFTQSYLDLN